MMENIKYCVVLFYLLSFSCHKKNGLELEILNNEVYAFCPNGDCNSLENRFIIPNYNQKAKNIVKFKITNYDKVTYIFSPICEDNIDYGCTLENAFPDEFMNISIGNFKFYNENNKEESRSEYISSYLERSSSDYYIEHKDSILNEYYNSIGYGDKSREWKIMNSELLNKSIIIHPGESLYFETYVRFPINENTADSSLERILLDKDGNYMVKLFFKSDIENIDKWLTQDQLQNKQINNYKVFTGELISINDIPLIITE